MSLTNMDCEINKQQKFSEEVYLSLEQPVSPGPKPIAQEMVLALLSSGYSKMNLANELGVSASTIKRISQGVIMQPGNRTFSKLIRLYCSEFLLNFDCAVPTQM